MADLKEVRNIVTIGAAEGGLEAVTRLVKSLNSDLDAAIFIVIHLSSLSRSDAVLKIIKENTAYKCIVPADQQEIASRTIYLAPADKHMVMEKGYIRIVKGALENQYRPSIDLLFRSAASAYTACVTGIILSGLLDDGTSGMNAIKRCGGRCIVQTPEEAAFPDMPNSVLQHMSVDYNIRIGKIGPVLNQLFSGPDCEQQEVPADIRLETEIARRVTTNMEDLAKLGDFTPLTCPSCGGAMVKVENDIVTRYRCYTGHSFTRKFIETEQLKRIEESLWVTIRMMEERKSLLLNIKLENRAYSDTDNSMAEKRIDKVQRRIDTLRAILLTLDTDDE